MTKLILFYSCCLVASLGFIAVHGSLHNGQAIKCYGDRNSHQVYRYSYGRRHRYTSVRVANAWDRNWRRPILIRCHNIPEGRPIWRAPTPQLREGQAIRCHGSPYVYRYTRGQRRQYRSIAVANAWDRNWRKFQVVHCDRIPAGRPLLTGPHPPQRLREGQSIRCHGSRYYVYRYTRGQRRQYRSIAVANAWDRNWRQAVWVFCAEIPQGHHLVTGPRPRLHEGQAIRCREDRDPYKFYRYTRGQRRQYLSIAVANAMDRTWRQAVVVFCNQIPEGRPISTVPTTTAPVPAPPTSTNAPAPAPPTSTNAPAPAPAPPTSTNAPAPAPAPPTTDNPNQCGPYQDNGSAAGISPTSRLGKVFRALNLARCHHGLPHFVWRGDVASRMQASCYQASAFDSQGHMKTPSGTPGLWALNWASTRDARGVGHWYSERSDFETGRAWHGTTPTAGHFLAIVRPIVVEVACAICDGGPFSKLYCNMRFNPVPMPSCGSRCYGVGDYADYRNSIARPAISEAVVISQIQQLYAS